MDNKQEFIQYLIEKKKPQNYIDQCDKFFNRLQRRLGGEPPTMEVIDKFARHTWSGYATQDKMMYEFLDTYATFCENKVLEFANAVHRHIKEAFEGLTKKAVRKYKSAIVFIPDDAKINPLFLEGLSNEEFIDAFRTWQELVYSIYEDIEKGSPFEWGFSSWKALGVDGVDQSRVMNILKELAECGQISGDALVVDKKQFGKACKPLNAARLMLEKFTDMGLIAEGLDNKKLNTFTVYCPDTPNLVKVMTTYFKKQMKNCSHDCNKCAKKCWHHIRDFSYRYVEETERSPQETYYLAHTEGSSEAVREIYEYLHDEAAKYGFYFQGSFEMGGLLYKKGSKKWLLVGSGSSYHECDYLCSPDYEIAVKAKFKNIFKKHLNKANELIKRFPNAFARSGTGCYNCSVNCENRISFEVNDKEKHHCGNHFAYFHAPTLNDVKYLLELHKLENNIK